MKSSVVAGEQNKYESGEHMWSVACERTEMERGYEDWHSSMQRMHVAQAVLLGLRGTPGGLVRCTPTSADGAMFSVHECVDDTIRTLVEPLLSTCNDHAVIWRFGKKLTTTFEYGIINQALGGALLDMCLSLHELVCELWDQLPTSDPISVVVHGISPYQPMFKLIRQVVDKHNGAKGSEVLCVMEMVRENLAHSYPNGVLLLDSIFKHTCAPFLSMIAMWIYQGDRISVVEGELPLIGSLTEDFMTWGVDEKKLPEFITRQANCVDMILQSGKLALVLKKTEETYTPRRLPLISVAEDFTLAIEDAWMQANIAVLNLLKGKHNIMSFFKFMHRYFLAGNATWLGNFIDKCAAKKSCSLSRTTREVLWSDLQQLLASSIEPEYSSYNISAEASQCQLFRHTKGKVAFSTDLPLISALQLSVDVKWPLSMVMTPTLLMKYNYMFRLLFRIKALRHDLNRCRAGRRSPEDKTTCVLLHSMTSLLSSLETYLCFEVIEPAFVSFLKTAEKTTTVQKLIDSHEQFIDHCLSLSLANDGGQLKLVEKVFLSIKLYSEAARRSITDEMVTRFRTQYTERLQDLLQSMECESDTQKGYLLQRLIRRLDFNYFYEKERRELV
eukprot:TRINITY_DN10787_c0_g1_i1.p1 TRINITY_DN10787_c0_g1~~TRINITY_DN10787_c0_g1_i1.p1  ORF type:complete len:614 (+),score=97.07 TRINITY_DN10787_c0_g1_i1:49-1890(+)